ncbi:MULTISPECIES: aspartyl-phosphate phosphatase Spo0E family protein [Brevibacillus]|uniref:aspartyl-phosphate phosphatase Spo0E family protein n=1 Tax=Brevibacillus TaxID=55080 RepID=UPI001EE1CA23|nr:MULTISPECIES: aspartyl-phosphate phosphatase Spo0E family protein [Brevibacillus]
MRNEDLLQKIDTLQFQLNEIFKQKGSLTDFAVLKVSQELDDYVVEHQRRMRDEVSGKESTTSKSRRVI